jgi:hypothetical protein
LCHYIFIRFIRLYVLLSYFSTSSSIFKIFGGIFIFSAFITFNAFSLISVLTQILFFPILTGIPNTELNSLNFVYWDTVIICFTERYQGTFFDFAVTNMTQRDDS